MTKIGSGFNAVVGAGAVDTKDVPDKTILVGNPARFLRAVGINNTYNAS